MLNVSTMGALESAGRAHLGLLEYGWYRCTNCKTSYPVIDGAIRCNGHSIELCPWCRVDSKPWTKGRGK